MGTQNLEQYKNQYYGQSSDPVKTGNLDQQIQVGEDSSSIPSEFFELLTDGALLSVVKSHSPPSESLRIDQLRLHPGWNLISIPGPLKNPYVGSLFTPSSPVDIVMGWAPTTASWLVSKRDVDTGLMVGGLPVLVPGRGYFVRTHTGEVISLVSNNGSASVFGAISLKAGWNLIGYTSHRGQPYLTASKYLSSLGNHWLKLMTYNSVVREWEDTSYLESGKGYWIYLDQNMDLVSDNS